jgi:hypothetical protein
MVNTIVLAMLLKKGYIPIMSIGILPFFILGCVTLI